MATWINRPNSRDVLDAAGRWKQQCLIEDRGLFSPERLWSAANADSLCKAYLGNPIVGSEKFIDKLERQLSNSPATVQKLTAECLWLLFLFVADNQMGAAAKRERITRIWSLSGSTAPESPLLSDEVLSGIANPGIAFMTKVPDELGFLLSVIRDFKNRSPDDRQGLLADAWRFGDWVDQQTGKDRRAFRHMLLYLCFPETYERISSWRHKRKIREAFEGRLPPEERNEGNQSLLATDQVLLAIRHRLEREYGTTELDFYRPPLRALWRQVEAKETPGLADEVGEGRNFWIEKTIVSGRPDRESGDYAVGKALWSPQKSKSGGDIYANMRRVKAGDVVFHLTDNEAITGVSTAAGSADDKFVGLAGTDWEGPAYRVQLTGYV
jgi:5-methylcytosine-specific restriction protein B